VDQCAFKSFCHFENVIKNHWLDIYVKFEKWLRSAVAKF